LRGHPERCVVNAKTSFLPAQERRFQSAVSSAPVFLARRAAISRACCDG
jgi:hypothetical protein